MYRVANTLNIVLEESFICKIFSCSWLLRTPFCVGIFSFKQIEHFGQVMVVFELQLNIMYSSAGLCVVLIVSLCGLFQGVSAALGMFYTHTSCLISFIIQVLFKINEFNVVVFLCV